MKNYLSKSIITCNLFFAFLTVTELHSQELNQGEPAANSVSITAQKTKATPLLVIELKTDKNKELKDCCKTIQRNLSFTGQFDISLETQDIECTKEQIKEHAKNYPFFVSITTQGNDFLAKLYDSSSLKITKIHSKLDHNQEEMGHKISNELLKLLTNKEGFFGSKIVFCRERKKGKTDICVADYDGKNIKTILSLNTLAIAPRWNNDPINPLILYSEYTATNLRLMITDLEGNKSIATNFDGLNMLPAFSPDGKEVVVCLSAKGNSQIYRSTLNKKTKKREYVSLTKNNGTNISPTILADGHIVFCSDFETKVPQIYMMDRNGKNLTCLTDGGFCTCPAYNPLNNKIAFIKMIEGRGQIMCYDVKKDSIKQITHDGTHKEEVSWSPCGNYILFATEDNNKKQLVVQSMLTQKRTTLTDGTSSVTYPYWSSHSLFSQTS